MIMVNVCLISKLIHESSSDKNGTKSIVSAPNYQFIPKFKFR
jgi:hypothetical protein